MELRNYHHIFCGTKDLPGDWGDGLSAHIVALKSSGLAQEIGLLYVGLVGTPDNRERVKNYLAGQIPYKIIAEADTGWEQETLDALLADCQEASQPFKVLYTHSKGSAFPSRMNASWRGEMTDWVVGKWRDATTHLDEADVTGIFWFEHLQFFAGNFFWANSSYIARLSQPFREDRHNAESWFRQVKPNIYCMKTGWPSIPLPHIDLVKDKENIMKVTFRCNGRVLKYIPNTIYTDELTPALEVLLKRDADLSLIDPPSFELLQKAKNPAPVPVPEPTPAPTQAPVEAVKKNAGNVKSVKVAANPAEHPEDRGSSNGNGAGGESRESTSSSEAVSSSS